MANTDCALAALVDCSDADKTITNFIEQKGYISSMVYGGIRNSAPMIRLLEKTKKEFPEGNGDTFVRSVLEVNNPNELDGLDWNPVKTGFPGSSPCCNEYRDFTYGSRTVTACLSQIGYKSPSFCKVDIVMKRNFMDQLMQIVMSMQNVSVGVWENWLKNSYPKSVVCVTLSKMWGHPEQLGGYVPDVEPTTFINVEHLDLLYERVQSAGGLIGSPIKDYQCIVIGRNSYNRLKRRRMEQNATLVGARGIDMSLPNYAEFSVDGLGKVVVFSSYAFVVVDKPRRFRAKANNTETWDDCIIVSTVNVKTDKGFKTDRNPDYYNPNIAVFEETLWLNLQAVDWLIPPAALAKGIGVGGKEFFPALNYAGDFEAVYCPEDPKKKTVRFDADFMGGMVSLFPQKGRSVFHLACHIEACDDDDAVCVNTTQRAPANSRSIRWTGITASSGQLQFLIEGTMPSSCPPGYTLFVTTEKGYKYPVGSVVSTTTFAGNASFPQPGQYVIIAFADSAVAVLRDDCDPFKFIECLPNTTPSNSSSDSPCGVCLNGGAEPVPCTLEVHLTADRIRGIKTAAGTDIISVTDYTNPATLATAITTALATHGGGTATVTKDSAFEWDIVITGNNGAMINGTVTYDDGLAATNTIPFGKFGGVCSS